MKKHFMSFAACAGLLLIPAASQAQVQYERICSLYGAGFNYIPGTDTCWNSSTGDARVQTAAGTWRSLLPYPEGRWVESPRQDCSPGRIVTLGTFSNNDFTLNAWGRLQTRAVPVSVREGEYIAKVIMSGGFSDPRTPNRHGANGTDGLCVRSVDPGVMENSPDGAVNPPFGNGMLPIGCVANSRIVTMPAAYSVSATAAYPSVDSFYLDGTHTAVAGPYVYGSALVVTTDIFISQLTPLSLSTGLPALAPGNLSVSVCVQRGTQQNGR